MYIIACHTCSAEVRTKSSSQKYCSAPCKNRGKPSVSGLTCRVCGEFMVKSASSLPQGEAAHRQCVQRKVDVLQPGGKPACSAGGCTRPIVAKGMCQKHWASAKPKCIMDGCANPQRNMATGWCNTHMERFKKHGDPHVTMKGKAHAVKYTDEDLRICTRCLTPKPDAEFHKDANGSRGRRAKCAACELLLEKQRYAIKSESIKARQRGYRASNLEMVRAQEKVNYQRNRESAIAASARAVHIRRARLKNLEADSGITVRSLRQKRGDKCEYCLVGLDFNPGKRGAISPTRASIEHIAPISRGGTHTWGNVTLACHQCNTSKNAKTLDEWSPMVCATA